MAAELTASVAAQRRLHSVARFPPPRLRVLGLCYCRHLAQSDPQLGARLLLGCDEQWHAAEVEGLAAEAEGLAGPSDGATCEEAGRGPGPGPGHGRGDSLGGGDASGDAGGGDASGDAGGGDAGGGAGGGGAGGGGVVSGWFRVASQQEGCLWAPNNGLPRAK